MFFRPGTVRIPFAAPLKARDRARAMQRIGLDPSRDRHARAALEAYADACAADMPWLAEWLGEMLGQPGPVLTRCAPTVIRVFDQAQAWAAEQPDYARTAWEHVRGQLHAALAERSVLAGEDDAGNGAHDDRDEAAAPPNPVR
ncbi:hypothetical protein [Burkholderia sp. Ac-20379]|uniref:hypothetical protein n=1 Tax=Burkholderia sp. Ac-20379 TaxID=2703900 RepID=UPI001F11A2CD|nr:hypothetical protein [Burkholderia sp. Ac-20379]